MAFELKEKRKSTVEGLFFLVPTDSSKNSDQLISGEDILVKKEKERYIEHLIQKHDKWLPKELKTARLSRRITKMKTLKTKVYFIFNFLLDHIWIEYVLYKSDSNRMAYIQMNENK